MKVAVECRSPLLQKSLELFLFRYLSSKKHCDIVVRDEACLEDSRCFYISSKEDADLKKPFSKSQLILALEKKYKGAKLVSDVKEQLIEERGGSLDFEILEKRIESLTREYQENILNAVRAFYEK
jgi:hypothetical protein